MRTSCARLSRRVFGVSFVALLLTACGAPPPPQMRYVFPLPPNQPKIEWLNTYASENDFPKTASQRMAETMVGLPPLTTFSGPNGIAADGEGKVFVADLYQRTIIVYDLPNRKVYPLFEQSPLARPFLMDMDSRKQLYVADALLKKVMVFSRNGQMLRSYGDPKELTNPVGVAVDEPRNRLYVTDSVGNRVVAYNLDDGRKELEFGGFSEKVGEGIFGPLGIDIAPNGDVYVSESLNARISVFDPSGKHVRSFGQRNDAVYGMEFPRDLAFDSEGNIWLLDSRREYVRAFNPQGDLLLTVGGPATHKMGFAMPTDIFIDANDEVYISDSLAARFSHWRYLSKGALARHPLTPEQMSLLPRADAVQK